MTDLQDLEAPGRHQMYRLTLREPGEDESAAEVPTAPVSTLETVADAVPEAVSAAVLSGVSQGEMASTVPLVPATVPRTVTSGCTRRARAASVKTPEKMFAAEIERGELPSVRAIKTRARCGTPRAQVIRDDLNRLIHETQPAAELPQP